MRLFFIFCILSFCSCNPAQDEAFQAFYQDMQVVIDKEPLFQAFLEKQLALTPSLIVPTEEEVQRILQVTKDRLKSLHHFELDRIDPSLHEHYHNLRSFLNIVIKNIETEKIHRRDPLFYQVLPYLEQLSKSSDKKIIAKGISDATLLMHTAIANLEQVESSKLEDAVTGNIAAFEFLSDEMATHLAALKLEESEQAKVNEDLHLLKLAIKDYIAYCNSALFETQDKAALKAD